MNCHPLNFNATKSVTYLPGTFCYGHARPLNPPEDLGCSPCFQFEQDMVEAAGVEPAQGIDNTQVADS